MATQKEQFNKILIPGLAIAATVFAITYGGRAVESVIEPGIDRAEQKAIKRKAEREKKEIKQDTILVTGKKNPKTGKLIKPYYVNLNTVASQIHGYYKKSNWFQNYGPEIENLLKSTYPYMMARISEIYRIKYGRSLIDDLSTELTTKAKSRMFMWLNKL
jgi:hypothetical protein